MPNYVILYHEPQGGESLPRSATAHFDWMFDHGKALWTWATDTLPDRSCQAAAQATDAARAIGAARAVRLPDHRRVYLSFEGALSGQRGKVRRVEWGTFEILCAEPDHFEFSISGGRNGIIAFQRTRSVLNGSCDDEWYWSFRPVRADAS